MHAASRADGVAVGVLVRGDEHAVGRSDRGNDVLEVTGQIGVGHGVIGVVGLAFRGAGTSVIEQFVDAHGAVDALIILKGQDGSPPQVQLPGHPGLQHAFGTIQRAQRRGPPLRAAQHADPDGGVLEVGGHVDAGHCHEPDRGIGKLLDALGEHVAQGLVDSALALMLHPIASSTDNRRADTRTSSYSCAER